MPRAEKKRAFSEAIEALYALGFAEGRSSGDAIRFASAASAIKCTRPGGRRGAPSREAVNAFLLERQRKEKR